MMFMPCYVKHSGKTAGVAVKLFYLYCRNPVIVADNYGIDE